MAWASADDVVQVTGQAATPASLALAQTLVELFSGTDTVASDAELISTRNLDRLKKAVCFQAIWLDEHPEVTSAMDVDNVSQDGLSANYRHENAHLMAPIAWRWLKRLSWWNAPLRVRKSTRYASDRGSRDSAVRDDQYEWSPLPFGSTP